MDDLGANISLKTSRSKHIVPVLNSIHMHSMLNPHKESLMIASSHQDLIKKKSKILILGLGFGYHVDAIIDECLKTHENCNIIVVDPNQKMVDLFLDNYQGDRSRFKILSTSIENIYMNKDFITFLLAKPAIIKHDPSYNLYQDFFKRFLTHKASTNISDYVEASHVKKYMERCHAPTLDLAIQKSNENNKLESHDFFIRAFSSIINKTSGSLK